MTAEFQELRLSKKLADSTAAEVFLAESPGTGTPVVLKVLRPEITVDAERAGEFLDQAQRCQTLRHPGLAQTLDSGRLQDGRIFLMSEFLEGESLRHCLSRELQLDPSVVKRLALPLCEALAYVHEQGVFHRDVTPENVFLAGGLMAFAPKLLDFGLSVFGGTESVTTAAGGTFASPAYAPPECIAGKPADARSDVYSLGVLLYELLTGAPPFVADDVPSLFEKIQNAPPPALPLEAEKFSELVVRCLAKKPEDRYAGAREVAAALTWIEEDAIEPTRITAAPLPLYPPVDEPVEAFGSYRVLELLGEGAMGNVYLAQHQRLGKKVAIKVLKAEHAKNRDLLERFFQEARTVNQINHEHIVDVHDFVDELAPDGTHHAYCVMEHLTGQTLAQVLLEGPISVRRVVSLMAQVCAGLGAAHQVGVVHRDVKPDNIFVSERAGVKDYVKMLDFGVAKLNRTLNDEKTGATLAGTIIGTPDYMSPEQAAGGDVDFRSDIYSVGVVLYESLALKRPFQAENFGQLAVDINTKAVPPLPPRTPKGESIPRNLANLVLRCLEKDPARRPESMQVVERELLRSLQSSAEMFFGSQSGEGDRPALHSAERSNARVADEVGTLAAKLRRRRLWRVAGVTVALVVAPLGLVFWNARAQPSANVSSPPASTKPASAAMKPEASSRNVVKTEALPAPLPLPAPTSVGKAAVHPVPAKAKTKTVGRPRAHAGKTQVSRDGVIDPYAGE